jgi:MFS transporter, SET family, sugar efflux transporter
MAADPIFRALAAMIGLLGILNACVFPYLPLIAVSRVGISETSLAMMMALASAATVLSSVMFGILSDQIGNRRLIALATVSASIVGAGLMVLVPLPAVLIIAHGLMIPMGTAIFGQIFVMNALASQRHPAHRDGLQATLRAMMSAVFLLALLIWTWALNQGGLDVMSVYPPALIAGLALWLVIWRHWPRKGHEPWQDQPTGLNLRAALAELSRPAIALRLLAMGAIGGLPMLYMVLTPLVMAAEPARQLSDVALMFGLVAGFEVPFMLALPSMQRRLARPTLIAGGAAIYAVFVVLLVQFPASPALWLFPVLAGLGAAPILTLPIGYWQDLMVGRPGTAAALLALQKLAGDLLAALIFATGTAISGYGAAALIGGALAIIGGLCLWVADRDRL